MDSSMIVIDGSQGEGGGQIFRSSLTLSMCLSKPVRIVKIRAGRSKPGLLRQHLTCLRAAREICRGGVVGDELGSREVEFYPGKVVAGNYRFAVGSAGSTSLVLQTVLLPLFHADAESRVELEGGTHNGMAPSFDYIQSCFFPTIATMGYHAAATLNRYGFYPAGGGNWEARIQPVGTPLPLTLSERGKIVQRLAIATSSKLPEHVTERELAYVQNKCRWPSSAHQQRLVKSVGPGNMLSLQIRSEHAREVAEVVGERHLRAERVADRAVKAIKVYLQAKVPVGEYLADQLLLPMVLGAGGEFRTVEPSQHLLTNIDVIRQFTGKEVRISKESPLVWHVAID